MGARRCTFVGADMLIVGMLLFGYARAYDGRKTARASFLAALALSISGCVYIPPIGEDKAIDPEVLVTGETTRSEAVSVLGEPLYAEGRFIYDELYSSSGGIFVPVGQGGYLPIDGQHKRILLEFDENEILIGKDVELGTALPSNIIGVEPKGVVHFNLNPLGEELALRTDTLFGGLPALHAAAFSPDGTILAASASSDDLYLIDLRRRSMRTISPEGFDSDGYVFAIAFSPDGTLLAVLSRTIRVIDMKTLEQKAVFEGHGNAYFWESRGARAMAFAPSGKVIASGGSHGDVKVWEAASGRQIATRTASEERIYGIAFSPDGKLLATASADGFVRLWDAKSGTRLSAVETGGTPIFSVDGTRLAIVNSAFAELRRLEPVAAATSQHPQIHVSDPEDMIILPYFSYRLHEALSPRSSRFSADGKAIFISVGPTMVWNWRERRKSHLSIPGGQRFLAFEPLRRTMATIDSDGVLQLWEIPSSETD